MRVANRRVAAVALALVILSLLAPLAVMAQPAEGTNGQASIAGQPRKISDQTIGMIVIAVAVVVGSSCVAAGLAVARVGSAALGAASERPELLGRSLILVGLAEGIAIYGLIIGIMLLGLIK